MKFDPTRDNLFSMRDEVAHTKLRSKMAAGVRSLNFALTRAITDAYIHSTLARKTSQWKALSTHRFPISST
jgi:hypothetical protein